MSNLYLYDQLTTFRNFKEFTNLSFYLDVPEDWYIVITDVVNSTQAIEKGEYKYVNMASALSLVAVINLNPKQKLPFIFGGDGITLLISKEMLADVQSVLADNRELVQKTFNLKLRVGFVAIRKVYEAGYELKIGKYQTSSKHSQMLAIGNGIDYAEYLVKNHHVNINYLISDSSKPHRKADYSGFACPFEDFFSHKEEILSLIIKVKGDDFEAQRYIYQEILSKMEFIFGSLEECHPLSASKSQFRLAGIGTDRGKVLMRLNLATRNSLSVWMARLVFKIKHIMGQIYMKISFKSLKNKNELINSSDHKKFDGSLKMTISCYAEQRELFQIYLQSLRQQGKIYFGLHVSDRTLVTCLVGSQAVHLVDAADGGYALAAKQIKQQILEE
jgi:Protein of unknown function (DUF3095)